MESHGNKSNVGNDAVGGESASAAPLSAYGPAIAQSAVQGIGMSTKDPCGPGGTRPKYAKAVSILFSNATSQKIMVDKHPQDVASTTHLWMYLKHDNRFRQVPMSEAAPGDVIVEAHVRDANGYAGIVVDHGRVVANSNQGVRINSSLADHQGSCPPMAAFRYMGVPGPLRPPLANAGFNEDEPRLPAGGPGGGQWTAGGGGAGSAPSTTIVTGVDGRLPGEPLIKPLLTVPGLPANARTFTYNGNDIHVPPNADFKKVYDAGAANGRANILGIKAAISHYGSFDFQRNEGHGWLGQNLGVNYFYPEYVKASNFAVGVFMAGAGFTWPETDYIASTFAGATSDQEKAKQIIEKDRPTWQAGWNYGQSLKASGK